MITRTYTCDLCGVQEQEPNYGTGCSGWTQYQGVRFNPTPEETITDPFFCPQCTVTVANAIDKLLIASREVKQ